MLMHIHIHVEVQYTCTGVVRCSSSFSPLLEARLLSLIVKLHALVTRLLARVPQSSGDHLPKSNVTPEPQRSEF